MDDQLLTIREVADALAITPHGVYRLIERGRIEAERLSPRRTFVRQSVLEAYQETFRCPPVRRVTVSMTQLLGEFVLITGKTPEEFLRQWDVFEIDETPENIRLSMRADALERWLSSPAAHAQSEDLLRRPGT